MSLETRSKQRTRQQEKSYHKGFKQIADSLIESGISLNVIIKNLDVRPSAESIKDIYRSIANAKYGIDSTTELTTSQVNEVWDDLLKAIGQASGVFVAFPARENFIDYDNEH